MDVLCLQVNDYTLIPSYLHKCMNATLILGQRVSCQRV